MYSQHGNLLGQMETIPNVVWEIGLAFLKSESQGKPLGRGSKMIVVDPPE
jgi:hypothetical protein